MRGNQFGKLFSITSFGESHGKAVGVVLDGVPANLAFSLTSLKDKLLKRAPGHVLGTTTRLEEDEPIVLSGVYEDKTLGSPICIIVENKNQKSEDYKKLQSEYRLGHADKTTELKYGIRDHRGGGRSSGRETIARVIGGYFASLLLPKLEVQAHSLKIGDFEYAESTPSFGKDLGHYGFPDSSKWRDIESYLLELQKNGESVGGVVQIVINNCPVALGEPAFDKLKADFAKALLSIGSVTSFSYGAGEKFASLSGKEASKDLSHFGGIEGGISNGNQIILTVTIKPTSTVGEKAKAGRHDPCIVPRVIPVLESMVKIVIADHFLRQKAYQL